MSWVGGEARKGAEVKGAWGGVGGRGAGGWAVGAGLSEEGGGARGGVDWCGAVGRSHRQLLASDTQCRLAQGSINRDVGVTVVGWCLVSWSAAAVHPRHVRMVRSREVPLCRLRRRAVAFSVAEPAAPLLCTVRKLYRMCEAGRDRHVDSAPPAAAPAVYWLCLCPVRVKGARPEPVLCFLLPFGMMHTHWDMYSSIKQTFCRVQPCATPFSGEGSCFVILRSCGPRRSVGETLGWLDCSAVPKLFLLSTG